MILLVDDAALTSDRDGGQHIVSSGHNRANFALLKRVDNFFSHILKLILHDEKAEEDQITLDLITLDGLCAAVSHKRQLFVR